MALPQHLHPKTYWEERSALTEEAMNRMVAIVANYCLPPAAHDDLREWAREWDRLLTELRHKYPAETPNVGANLRAACGPSS